MNTRFYKSFLMMFTLFISTSVFSQKAEVFKINDKGQLYYLVNITLESHDRIYNDRIAPIYAKSALMKHLRKSNKNISSVDLTHFTIDKVVQSSQKRKYSFKVYPEQISLSEK